MIIYNEKTNENDILSVEVISEKTFRIRLYDTYVKESALNRYGIIENKNTKMEINQITESNVLKIETSKAKLEVNLVDGKFVLRKKSSKKLLECTELYQNRGQFEVKIKYENGSKIYGLGDVTRNTVEKTGYETEIWVENVKSYIPIPFINSDKGFGIFLNTTWRHTFDIGKTEENIINMKADNGGFDVYLFACENIADVLNEYTNLIGKPAMLPRFAYGLVYVCNQKVNDSEMLSECKNFRDDDIPCDVCGLEPGWMSKHYDYSIKKSWDSNKFYLPPWCSKGDATFLGALDRLGFKLSLWLCCNYDLSYEEERQISKLLEQKESEKENSDDFEKDLHFAIKETDIEPWFEHLKKFVDQGASCFKLDGADQVNPHPDKKWGNGMDDEEMHNLYPIIYNKQMSRGFTEYTGRRSMIYSSGGYAGIQKYSASWAGDTGGGPKPLMSMLNLGLSGHVNTSCDMDIFTNEGIHFGFFQPWSQLCNWAYWRQPWYLQPEREEIYRFYAKLRYKMLPYIYTLAHKAYKDGYPIMRAMSFEYPETPNADKMYTQYMFGDSILTSAFAQEITVPKGIWYNGWTNEKIEGGQTLKVKYPENRGGPLYIKEGSVIPTCEFDKFIGDKQPKTIEFNIYAGKCKTEYKLYEDDGITEEYKNGAYAETKIEISEITSENTLKVVISKRDGNYEGMPEIRDYKLNFVNIGGVNKVKINGEEQKPTYRKDTWCGYNESGYLTVYAANEGVIEVFLK